MTLYSVCLPFYFCIFQNLPKVFNKAALMNAGFLEVLADFQPDCVVFHDVDMIPENDRNFYTCFNTPRHMGAYINKFRYRYTQTHGAVC